MGSAVDKENLEWQMQQLAQAGIATLEITPIYGVKGNASKNITFLTPQWLDMLAYCKDQGNQLGIDIDMTTGTGWPFGGPMVRREESASKLVTETFDIEGDGTSAKTVTLNTGNGELQRVMAFPQAVSDGSPVGTVTDITSLVDGKTLQWTAPAGKWKLIAAYCQYGVMQVKRPAPGSSGLVLDYFDKDAVANYLKYFDTKFEAANTENSKSIWPRSFFNDSYEINQADWTRSLFDEFLKRRGYRLEEYLDLLIGVTGTSRINQASNLKSQIYSDYRQTLSDMLLENFTRQWTQWAHSHGATTRNQAHGSPGNIIDLYAEADIPETENFYMNNFGIRGLRNDVGYYMKALSSRATLKYASSAAHITGKPLTSSESMTWLTEHFRTSLSQIKPELDFLFTSGVNHILFHGTAYSPREAAWPGWKFYAAIDMSPTNSIWHDAPAMMKYIERVQSFMQMGQPDNDVLVYAPFANAWRKTTGSFQNRLLLFDINTMGTKMSELEQCVNNLEAIGLDCDYTSERYLMTTSFVDGQLQTAAGTRYKALVIPVGDNLPDSVKNHLDALAAQGAQIVYGRDAAALGQLLTPGSDAAQGGSPALTPEAMRTDMGLSVIRRSNATGHHYFIANLTPNDAEGFVPLAVNFKSAVFFDPMTGDITSPAIADGKVWLSLKSGQSVILQTYDSPVTVSGDVAAGVSAPAIEMAALPIDGFFAFTFDSEQPQMMSRIDRPQTWENFGEQGASFMGTGSYEAKFTVTRQQLQTATAGFRLDLGDVRESARVWLNDVFLGCAWAVPFVLDCKDAIREGENKLWIEVTNLPANRIRQMDIDGQEWRIFEDINMSNISTASYAGWDLVPSGLNSKVSLIPLAKRENSMTATMTAMHEDDGQFYPVYSLSTSDGKALASLTMTAQDGQPFDGYEVQKETDGTMTLTVKGISGGRAVVTATDSDGTVHYAYVPAYGPYSLKKAIDFTADSEPLGGWTKLSSTSAINGFGGTGKLPWYRSKANGKSLLLYDGMTFVSDKSNYYFYFLDYGMNTNNDFSVVVADAPEGSICAVSYLQGEGETVYEASDSLMLFTINEDDTNSISIGLLGNKSMTVYRTLAVYTPTNDASAIQPAAVTRGNDDDAYYSLQGIRTLRPRKGLYIRNGRIVRIISLP